MRFPTLAAALLLLAAPAFAAQPWEDAITSGLGRSGAEMPGGVYRVPLPRTDLHVQLNGVALKPGFAFGGWLGFAPHGAGGEVMVMGDLVLLDEEVNPVMKRLLDGGIEVTALHNHLLGATPHTMFMHVSGQGPAAALAATLRSALALSKLPAAAPAAAPPVAPASVGFDVAAVEAALGAKAKNNNGIIAFSIPRSAAPVAGGMAIPDAMGSAIAINFQPLGAARAAITGDFVLAANEVEPVLRSLRAAGIDVTALHNHMLDDEPRLFFMHFWAADDAVRLARGLADALSHVARSRT